jgi:hypothetical protein
MSEHKSRWDWILCGILLLPILSWASAPVSLRVSGQYGRAELVHQPVFLNLPADWWCAVYAPVLWAAEDILIGPIQGQRAFWLKCAK